MQKTLVLFSKWNEIYQQSAQRQKKELLYGFYCSNSDVLLTSMISKPHQQVKNLKSADPGH